MTINAMPTNVLFDAVMGLLWNNSEPDAGSPPPPKEAVAIASYVKNHRVNAENAFEVLRIMWPDSLFQPRCNHTPFGDDPSETAVDVKFVDGSQVLIIARRGLGDAVEVI